MNVNVNVNVSININITQCCHLIYLLLYIYFVVRRIIVTDCRQFWTDLCISTIPANIMIHFTIIFRKLNKVWKCTNSVLQSAVVYKVLLNTCTKLEIFLKLPPRDKLSPITLLGSQGGGVFLVGPTTSSSRGVLPYKKIFNCEASLSNRNLTDSYADSLTRWQTVSYFDLYWPNLTYFDLIWPNLT